MHAALLQRPWARGAACSAAVCTMHTACYTAPVPHIHDVVWDTLPAPEAGVPSWLLVLRQRPMSHT